MKKILIFSITITLLAAACTPELSFSPTSLAAWIDAPLHKSTIPLAPYEIVVHGSDPEQINLIEVSINGQVLGETENPDLGNLLFSVQMTWTPPAPGTYTIQARGQNSKGVWSSPALAQVEVKEVLQPQPMLEIIPTATPSLELVSCDPQARAITNTTCRQGPTTYHAPVDYLLEGESAPVLGGNQDLSWWAVRLESQGDHCWISGQTVETSCIPEQPEILESPPYITRVFPSHDEFYWGDNPLQTVTIQAQSGGEISVTEIWLIYRLAGKAAWYNTAMASTGGGIWQAQINARTFDGYKTIDSAVVEYYLQATNQAGLITKSPLFTDLTLKKVP